MEEIRLRPWAKINLYLEVLGKRDNGYHEIRTLIQPIALFDELGLKRIPQGLKFNCKTKSNLPGREDLPLLRQNIVCKAAELFFSKIKEKPRVEINLEKNIPIRAGLGGGSSNAASTLAGLNKLWGGPLRDKELQELAAQLGMDVPCFLEPKPTICIGRGEVIAERLEGILKLWCVLINPGKGLSTASVYKELSLSLTKSGGKDNILRFLKKPDNINSIITIIRNDLEGTATRLSPILGNILDLLNKAGALKSFVCGSGSTVCGLAAGRERAFIVAERIRKEGEAKDWWIEVVSTL